MINPTIKNEYTIIEKNYRGIAVELQQSYEELINKSAKSYNRTKVLAP